jgi:hypothetical protein
MAGDGAAIGFAAFATADGTNTGDGIDAIQLGTGGNSATNTVQAYAYRLMNADGTIPAERLTLAPSADGGATNIAAGAADGYNPAAVEAAIGLPLAQLGVSADPNITPGPGGQGTATPGDGPGARPTQIMRFDRSGRPQQ